MSHLETTDSRLFAVSVRHDRADQRSFVSIDFNAIEIQRQVFGNAIDQVD